MRSHGERSALVATGVPIGTLVRLCSTSISHELATAPLPEPRAVVEYAEIWTPGVPFTTAIAASVLGKSTVKVPVAVSPALPHAAATPARPRHAPRLTRA